MTQRDEIYLRYLRRQVCCICRDNVSVEAAHLRMSSINDDKPSTGMAQKSSDKWALPLCGKHHREQHTMSEREFWAKYDIDPIALCMHYQANPDDDPLLIAMKERGKT